VSIWRFLGISGAEVISNQLDDIERRFGSFEARGGRRAGWRLRMWRFIAFYQNKPLASASVGFNLAPNLRVNKISYTNSRMLYRCLEILVAAFYAMPIIGLVALALPVSHLWIAFLVATPILLLSIACVMFAHVCIINAVRGSGRRFSGWR
jgi:hypothetical protein